MGYFVIALSFLLFRHRCPGEIKPGAPSNSFTYWAFRKSPPQASHRERIGVYVQYFHDCHGKEYLTLPAMSGTPQIHMILLMNNGRALECKHLRKPSDQRFRPGTRHAPAWSLVRITNKNHKTKMKKIFKHTFAIAFSAAVLGGISASAYPTYIASTSYDGNTFSLWANPGSGTTWASDEAFAVSRGGYLAVLPDSATIQAVYAGLINNGFFQPVAGQAEEAYLGAVPANGSDSTTDPNNWAWVNGTLWSTADADNFNAGEPNGDSDGLAINRYGTFTFNDESGLVGGFIAENINVPDGGSTVMLLGGALGLVGVMRRKLPK
jgi:hypothetical protein